MKRLVMLAAASLMALMLGACGQNAPKQPEPTTPDTTMEQPKVEEKTTTTTEEQKTETNDAAPTDTQSQE